MRKGSGPHRNISGDLGIPRSIGVQILESFVVETVRLETAGNADYGVRFFSEPMARARGRYLTPTLGFQGSAREALALARGNAARSLRQFRLRPGAKYISGKASPLFGHEGGGEQWFVPELNDLMESADDAR